MAVEEAVDGQPSQEIYNMEMVLNSRKKGTTTEYLIKWQGYDPSQNTWEPKKNIPLELVEAFEQAKKGADVEVEACKTEAEKTRDFEQLRFKREVDQKVWRIEASKPSSLEADLADQQQ